MKFTNLRTFMFEKVIWAMPAPMNQRLMRKGSSDRKEKISEMLKLTLGISFQ
jgi:hypothetical protein